MKKLIRISGLLAAMTVVASAASAAGLGRLSVQSALGQPLKAEIELLSVSAEDLANVQARLASPEAFRQARIERGNALADLQLVVDKRANGQPVVRISSGSPVNDPFVDLLIELNWSSGRVLREYTVLLDPVKDVQESPPPVAVKPVLAPVSAAPAEPRSVAPAASSEPPDKAAELRQTYGPVKSGENLKSIAAKVRLPDVSLDMMMASLYQANQKAFARGNMNLIKRGQVLSVPERDAVMQMFSPHQAQKLIGEHAAAWHALQGRVADQAARNVAEPVGPQPGKGKIVPEKKADTPVPQAEKKDVLKLSKGEPAKSADARSGQRVQALEEEVAAKSRALQEAQDRVNKLESTVRDLQRLMALKGKDAAPVPDKAPETTPAPAVEAVKAPPEPAKPVAKPPKVAPPVDVPIDEPSFVDTLLAKPLYLAGGFAALVLAGLLWVFMTGKRRRKGLSDFEQSVMTGGDQFKTSIFKTGGASTERGSVTQSGAATDFSRLGLGSIDTHEVDPIAEAEVYMAYGRDAQAEEILKEALSKDPYRHEIVLKLLEIYTTRQDTASFETQASELYANLGDPASPIWAKAAEMGRRLDPNNPLYRVFGEAPELPAVVKQAPSEEPMPGLDSFDSFESAPAPVPEEARFDLAEPRLEAAPAAKFEPAAEPMSEDFGDGLEFDLASAPDLQPASAAKDEPSAMAGLADLDFGDLSLDLATEPATEPVKEAHIPAEPAHDFPAFGVAIEPDLGHEAEIEISAPESEQDTVMPEELDSIDLAAPVPVLADELVMPDVAEMSDFADLDLPDELPAPPATVAEALPDLDFSGIDLDDLDEADKAAPQAPTEPSAPAFDVALEIDSDLLEEVNTKLDLARAYLEMGDREGAREILDEVVKEGDGRQKQEAEKLIASL